MEPEDLDEVLRRERLRWLNLVAVLHQWKAVVRSRRRSGVQRPLPCRKLSDPLASHPLELEAPQQRPPRVDIGGPTPPAAGPGTLWPGSEHSGGEETPPEVTGARSCASPSSRRDQDRRDSAEQRKVLQAWAQKSGPLGCCAGTTTTTLQIPAGSILRSNFYAWRIASTFEHVAWRCKMEKAVQAWRQLVWYHKTGRPLSSENHSMTVLQPYRYVGEEFDMIELKKATMLQFGVRPRPIRSEIMNLRQLAQRAKNLPISGGSSQSSDPVGDLDLPNSSNGRKTCPSQEAERLHVVAGVRNTVIDAIVDCKLELQKTILSELSCCSLTEQRHRQCWLVQQLKRSGNV